MRRLRKRFKRPLRPYDSRQIAEGKTLQQTYGLRRKKEIWIAQEMLRRFRERARELIAIRNPERERSLLDRLARLGLLQGGATLDDVLGLKVEHILDRRLETLVWKAGKARTPRQARQAIVHGHVFVEGRRIVHPSYLVAASEEASITSTFKVPDVNIVRGVTEQPEEAAAEEAPA